MERNQQLKQNLQIQFMISTKQYVIFMTYSII